MGACASTSAATALPPRRDAPTALALRAADGGEGAAAVAAFSPGDSAVALALTSKRKGVTILGEGRSAVADAAAAGQLRKRVVPKAAGETAFIMAALAENALFAALAEADRAALADAMEPVAVAAGTLLIREGDVGDALYAVESGRLEIVKGGSKVADWGTTAARRIVGELALLYGGPRAASVRAATNARLWRLDREAFQMTMAASAADRLAHMTEVLRKGILEGLEEPQLARVAAAATAVSFRAGDCIIRKGDIGEIFYIIERGAVVCRNLPGEQHDNTLTAGDYFGERALLTSEARACDVFAATDVALVALHREDFVALLGSLRALLDHNMGMRLLLCVPLLANL